MSTPRLPRHAVDRLLSVGAQTESGEDSAPPAAGGLADLGRYRLLRELGRGGMGRVYLAEDTQLGRVVALKLMPETVGLSEVMRRRFAREAQAVAKLNHPNIAAVYDATPDYIAMQFVDGTLILDQPREDPRYCAALIRDAALAVQYAHDSGVIHRDLKPSNLMVEKRDGSTGSGTGGDDPARGMRVVVLDFGLAKEAEIESSLSRSGSIVGTPAYMPPEQAEGRSHDVDRRSDVYGLGATLYACLTGQPPFVEDEVLSVLRRVVEEDPRPPKIESDLDAIVLKCLEKEPARRYQSAREFADDLGRWLRGEPVVAKPPSLAYRLRKFVGRRKALLRAIAIATGVTLAVAGVFVGYVESQRRGAEMALEFSSRLESSLQDAAALFRNNEGEQARGILDDATQQAEVFLEDYDVAHVHYLLGRLLRQSGKRTRARIELDRAIELDPAHVGARLERGLLVLARRASLVGLRSISTDAVPGDAEDQRIAELRRQAREDLEFVAQQEEELRIVDTRYAFAELERLEGNLDRARLELEHVLELEPQHGEARFALARIHAALGDEDLAREYNAGATDLRMGFAPAFLARSTARPGSGAPAVVDPAAETLVGTPARVEGLDAVAADFTRALRQSTASGLVANTSGLAEMARAAAIAVDGRPDVALAAWRGVEQELDSMLTVHEGLVGAHVNRGICRAEIEKLLLAKGSALDAIAAHRGALADFDAAVERAPAFAPAWFDRGLLRMHQAERLAGFGRFAMASLELEQAIADHARALELDEGSLDALLQRARARERWASLLALQGIDRGSAEELARAVEDHDLAVERHAEDPAAWLSRGLFRSRRGGDRAPAAVVDLQRALELAPADWAARAQCQQALAELGGSDG